MKSIKLNREEWDFIRRFTVRAMLLCKKGILKGSERDLVGDLKKAEGLLKKLGDQYVEDSGS